MIRAAAVAVLVALLSSCTLEVDESRLLFPHRGPAVDVRALEAAFPGHRVEESWIRARDGTRLYSLRFGREDAVATVLYFGGNGYTIGRFARYTADAYRSLPVDLVLVDHRGYGRSEGRAHIEAMLADAEDAYAHVRRGTALPVVVHGHSLGSFLAGHLALRHRLDGLVLESSVTTAAEWAGHFHTLQPWWVRMVVWRARPVESLAERGNAALMAELDEPVLFVVGGEDLLTPPRFTRELHSSAAVPDADKRLVVVPGAGHDGADRSPGFREGVAWLLDTLPAARPR